MSSLDRILPFLRPIEDLLRDPSRADEMGRAGKEYVRQRFLSTRELEDWLRLFGELR